MLGFLCEIQYRALAKYLWSPEFDLQNHKNIFFNLWYNLHKKN